MCEYRDNDSAAARASTIEPPPQMKNWSPRTATTSARGNRPLVRVRWLGKRRKSIRLVYPAQRAVVQSGLFQRVDLFPRVAKRRRSRSILLSVFVASLSFGVSITFGMVASRGSVIRRWKAFRPMHPSPISS
jgi:hypothetical protein